MNILIRNGRIIDPATKTDEISDLYIEGGKVKKTGKGLKPKDKTDKSSSFRLLCNARAH